MEMKPILFNTDMVCAILEYRKTVTRRVVKPQPRAIYHSGRVYDDDGLYVVAENRNGGLEQIELPYHPGSILYVRETWCQFDSDHVINGVKYAYKADSTPESERVRKDFEYKWHPSIHMPREAARIFLRVTDVRVERLKNITDEDLTRDFDLCQDAVKAVGRDALAGPFWDSTIKPADRAIYGWEANPYVWRVSFERISKEEAHKCA